MKLSRQTLAILKNFGAINGNLVLSPGPGLRTVSAGKNIVAEASVPELGQLDHTLNVYDLNEFLASVSLFEDPEIEVQDGYAILSEDNASVKYFSASPSIMTEVPKLKEFPEVDIQFTLKGDFIGQLHKVASVVKAADLCIVGDGSKISLQVKDKANDTSNNYRYVLADTDKVFSVNFKVENLKMIPGDYEVSIGGKKISRWQHCHSDLVYYIAIELDSTFDF